MCRGMGRTPFLHCQSRTLSLSRSGFKLPLQFLAFQPVTMNILGIECTGRRSSVALLRDGQSPAVRPLMKDGKPATQFLVSTVKELCQEAGIEPRALELLAITKGPGSFTGLRIGLTFAKTFAWANGCILKAVPTFNATVEGMPAERKIVEVVEDLRRGQVAWQRFEFQDDVWQPVNTLQMEDLDSWRQRNHSGIYHAGAGLERLARQLPNREWPADWRFVPEEEWMPDAMQVAALGRRLYEAEGGDDPFQVTPIYVRKSAAEERAGA